MLIPKIDLTFFQYGNTTNVVIPFEGAPPRDEIIRINFCNHFEINDSTDTLINTGTIILPKNKLWVNKAKDSKDYPETETNLLEQLPLTNIGLTNSEGELTYNLINDYNPESEFANKQPIFKIGDIVLVRCSYYDPYTGLPISQLVKQTFFRQFVITSLKLEEQLEIGIASLSWFYKQVPVNNITLNKGENLVDFIVEGNTFTADKFAPQLVDENNVQRIAVIAPDDVNFDDKLITTGNQSFAQFLDMLKKDYRLVSYMVNDNLVFPKLMQLPSNVSNVFLNEEQESSATKLNIANPKIFCFQNNIIDSNMEYKSKDGLKLSAIVSNTFLAKDGSVTKDGNQKTKRRKLSVYIEYTQDNDVILQEANFFTKKLTQKELTSVIQNLKGIKILSNYNQQGQRTVHASIPAITQNETDGERRTLTFYEAKTIEDLIALGLQELQKFFYEGFTGSFTTFGEPTVLLSDIITLIDKEKPEKSGYYRVKEVVTTFGVDGYRQEVELDIKLPGNISTNSIRQVFVR